MAQGGGSVALYDLRFEAWIPWRRRSGRIHWGPISALAADLGSDPVVGLAAPRPDFDAALTEFLIGLLTTALAVRDEDGWHDLWREPPDPADFEAKLRELPPAFNLDGDGARFLQDLDDLVGSAEQPVERLLFDTPGDQTQARNTDLFVKRNRVASLAPSAAAMALLTMQTYAPAGGTGHRTSMRGGGPLTTLVDPRDHPFGLNAEALWFKLWANVETREQLDRRTVGRAVMEPSGIFPWLAPTRASAGGRATTPADGHPLQAYFGMPRRVRLLFEEGGRCDLTGQSSDRTVSRYRSRNLGVNYEGWAHPLSPYYRSKAAGEWLPVHPQPDGLSWKDWFSLTIDQPPDANFRPASTVAHFAGRRARRIHRLRPTLVACGVDFDNMKCRGWVAGRLPMFVGGSADDDRLLRVASGQMTRAADLVASVTKSAVKQAWFGAPEEATGDFSAVTAAVWSETEAVFYDVLQALQASQADEQQALELMPRFRDHLAAVALRVFDRCCPTDTAAVGSLRRVVGARRNLYSAVHGFGKLGARVFGELGLRVPEAGGRVRPRKKGAEA